MIKGVEKFILIDVITPIRLHTSEMGLPDNDSDLRAGKWTAVGGDNTQQSTPWAK